MNLFFSLSSFAWYHATPTRPDDPAVIHGKAFEPPWLTCTDGPQW